MALSQLVVQAPGTLIKSGSTTVNEIRTRFENFGSIDLRTGLLQLSGGGTQTGTIKTTASAVLVLNAGTFTFSGATPGKSS